jgi:hypothetical protein
MHSYLLLQALGLHGWSKKAGCFKVKKFPTDGLHLRGFQRTKQ